MVTGRKHSEDQLKGDKGFYNKGTSYWDVCIYLCGKNSNGTDINASIETNERLIFSAG